MPKGRHPKPAHMRQNRTKKFGAAVLTVQDPEQDEKPKVPTLQNPDKRKFHRLTRGWWRNVWRSPMAQEYLPTDIDVLGRLAIMVDNFYKNPTKDLLAEIRLQEARFGLSPVDRSRMQWEVQKGEEAQRKRKPSPQQYSGGTADPRQALGVVKEFPKKESQKHTNGEKEG